MKDDGYRDCGICGKKNIFNLHTDKRVDTPMCNECDKFLCHECCNEREGWQHYTWCYTCFIKVSRQLDDQEKVRKKDNYYRENTPDILQTLEKCFSNLNRDIQELKKFIEQKTKCN